MTMSRQRCSRLSTFAGLLTVVVLAATMSAQQKPAGMPSDWTHRHLVFSNPGTYVQMLNPGVSQDRWVNWVGMQGNSRFMQQQRQRAGKAWNNETALAFELALAQAVDNNPSAGNKKKQPVTALQRDWNVSIGNAPPAAMYPATFALDFNAPSCTNDFAVFPVNISGATQANLIGFNNLYVPGRCGTAAAPNFKFAYKIGSGVIQTSPVMSMDGTKIALVESVAGGSKFHVLTIGTNASNEGTSTVGVVPGTGGSNAVDAAVSIQGGVSVTRSSPFIDYDYDAAYVGDDAGVLHKFSPVFNGTPAEVTVGWPFTVASGVVLTGPVVNGTSIYVGGGTGSLYCVTTAGAACGHASIAVGTVALLDPPMIDGSTGYVFVATKNASNAILVQASADLSSKVTVTMGGIANSYNIHNGAFDNGYLTGADPSAGHMYFCGNQVSQQAPTLWRVGFNSSGLINSTNDGSSFMLTGSSGNSDECSSLTEVYNANSPGGGKDLLFVGMAAANHGCGSLNKSCVGSLDITSGMPVAYQSTFQVSTGLTSGIVVDNVADVVPVWGASTAYAVGSLIVDSNGKVQKCTTAGTSGSASPTWSTTKGGTTSDGTVTWTLQGPYTGSWQASHLYSANAIVTDSSNRLQRTNGGTSGASQPAFTATTTADNGMTWTNLGSYTQSSVSSIYLSTVGDKKAFKLTQIGLQ
jgi:hypothetical protein